MEIPIYDWSHMFKVDKKPVLVGSFKEYNGTISDKSTEPRSYQ